MGDRSRAAPDPIEPSLGNFSPLPSFSSRPSRPLCIARSVPMIRGLHSPTFQLNISAFC